MRPIWSAAISFGLVTIPVKLYSAVSQRSVSFNLLHKKDNSPIKYKRWCQKENKEVPWSEIIKGIEVAKGRYYTTTKEELEKLKPEKSDYIEIVEFIDKNSVDPIYFNSHYYLAPEKEKEKAYFLFKDVLQLTGKLAVGRFVMREKEYTCVIGAYKSGMLLTTLNYAYEIRDITEISELKSMPKLSQEEIDLAKQLMGRLYKEEFDVSKFEDTFLEQLKEAIKAQAEGIQASRKGKKVQRKDLMEALRASLRK